VWVEGGCVEDEESTDRGSKAYAVRWEVCDSTIGDYSALEGEALLLEPLPAAVARVGAVPDPDCSPKHLSARRQEFRQEPSLREGWPRMVGR